MDNNGMFSISAPPSGVAGVSYQWLSNGVPITGATNDTYFLANSIGSGLYQLIISNSLGAATSSVVSVSFDIDRNGLADSWENGYFGHAGVDPNADADGDGVVNLDEYLEGTNPTNGVLFNPRLNLTVVGNGCVGQSPSQRSYTNNQIVQLTATAAPGNTFIGWFGDLQGNSPITNVSMNGHKRISAYFGLPLETALDATNVTWSTGGDAVWIGQTTTSYDGVSAAQVEPIQANQQSWLQTTVTNLHATIVYFRALCSFDDYHNSIHLDFGTDGTTLASVVSDTGNTWLFGGFLIQPGVHNLRWTYSKLLSIPGSTRPDGAWVDQVQMVTPYPVPLSNSQVVVWGRVSDGQSLVPADLTNAVTIAAGSGHGLAIRSDGTVRAWGDNALHQTDVPSGLGTVRIVAAGYDHNLALKTNGVVVGWGYNNHGEANAPAGLSNVVAVAAGQYHSVAVRSNGSVTVWGYNNYGQTNVPAGLPPLVDAAGGQYHTLGLTGDGKVVAWGLNADGQCDIPPGATNVIAIAGGGSHSLALKANGTVLAWGKDNYGQIEVPANLSNVVAIAAGRYHSMALKDDGSVVAWGRNNYFQTNTPNGVSSVIAIAAGELDSMAVVGDGTTHIIRQPASQNFYSGMSGTLIAGAVGISPLSYQWLLNGTNLPGANSAVLVLPNLTTGALGTYTLLITTPLGTTATTNITVTVSNSAPIWVLQPSSQAQPPGSKVSLFANAQGSLPITYQWLVNGTNLPGATNASLTLQNLSVGQAGNYQAIAQNAYGSITSSPAQVTISSPLLITTIAGHAGSSGSSDGTNFNSYFNAPSGLAVDASNNVFVADTLNKTVRMISQVGTNWVVKTIAGLAGASGTNDGVNGQARFAYPSGLVVDSSGSLYVADVTNYTIRKISPNGTNWTVTTVAGLARSFGSTDGTNSAARFGYPFALAIDPADNLYVGDTFNYTVRKIRQSGTNYIVTTIAGLAGAQGAADGTNSNARFSLILGLALDATGVLYVSDSETNNTLRKITPVGTNWVVTTLAGLTGVTATNDGVGSLARFNSPRGLVFGSDGILYVADCRNYTIRGVITVGTNAVVTTVAGRPGAGGVNIDGLGANAEFSFPWALARDAGGRLFISDALTNHLVRLAEAQTSPVIVTQPLSETVNVGGTAQFTVVATGTAPLAYQWLSNGTNIPGVNSPVLVLTNRQVADSGTFYGVVVSNSLAAVTSDVVELTVSGIQWRLVMDNDQFGIQNGEFGFDVSGGLDATYVIESSTNLVDWFPVATNTLVWGTNRFSEAFQSNSIMRFYRSVFFP